MAKILIIDDDAFFLKLMANTLREQGHEIETATDGQNGEAAFDAATFDAVVCDLVMPRQEGLETIRYMKQRSPAVAIVAVSGGLQSPSGLDVLSLAEKLGAHIALRKPFLPPQLVQAVNVAMSKVAPAALTANAGN